MMKPNYHFHEFDSVGAAQAAVAQRLSGIIEEAVHARGRAAMMLSGGSTPGPAYQALSAKPLPWQAVSVGLVDDRWVEPTSAASNERLIRETLLQGAAARAKFVGLKTDAASPQHGLDVTEARLASLPDPFDVCVMGMGLDGHTASWFPGAKGLYGAMDSQSAKRACAIDATGSPVAGDNPLRISLTLPAVMDSRNIILFFTGREKRTVFEASQGRASMSAPVGALTFAGPRLSVYWAA